MPVVPLVYSQTYDICTYIDTSSRRLAFPAENVQRAPLLRLYNRPVNGIVCHEVNI